MESILGIILCCKQLGDPEGEYSYTTESYNFCCTGAELAAYYRNLGWYYLEKYKPEVAASCYLYSKYFEDSQQALDCYRMVYDLTADEEVEKIISEME